MERTRVVRNLFIAAIVFSIAMGVVSVGLWVQSYNGFAVARGPLFISRGFQVASNDGRLEIAIYRSTTTVPWNFRLVTRSHLEQAANDDPAMRLLQRRYQTMRTSLARLVESDPLNTDLRSQMEWANQDYNAMKNQFKVQMINNVPFVPNVAVLTSNQTNGSTNHISLSHCGFADQQSPGQTALTIPFWFSTLVGGATAVLLTLRPRLRFSLRTMLITMTLVAITLGLVKVVNR
jgi:hypothetical protein